MRECKGVVWGSSWLGATGRRFCHKTQRMPAKCVCCVCVYCVWCTLFPPVVSRQFLSVHHNSLVLGKLFGLGVCLLFHSLLAGWGWEEECGNSASIALHSLTLPGPGNESREGGCVPSPWPYGDFFKAMDCNVKTWAIKWQIIRHNCLKPEWLKMMWRRSLQIQWNQE